MSTKFKFIGIVFMMAMLISGCNVLAANNDGPSHVFGTGEVGQVQLWWAFSANQHDLVMIERSDAASGTWQQIAALNAKQTTYTDNGLDCQTTYQYRLRGFSQKSNSYTMYSPATTVKTADCPAPDVNVIPDQDTDESPTPDLSCTDSVAFVADVSVPDGSLVDDGAAFTKTWRILNDGTCEWTTGYSLAFINGHQLNGPVTIPIPYVVKPGEEIEISANLIAPTTAGNYHGEWQMRTAGSMVFGKRLWVDVWVEVEPTARPTNTPRPATETLEPTTPAPTATPTDVPTNTPTPVITDWKGEYYNNRTLSGDPVLVRNDKQVEFNWKNGSPHSSLPADDFSVRWTQRLRFDGGMYRFFAAADDGVRVWVDDELIINHWKDSPVSTYTGDIALTTGKHTVTIEYYEHGGEANINVSWKQINTATYPDWKGEYWDNRKFSGNPVFIRNDKKIDFNWKKGAPAAGMPSDDYAIRWTRTMEFEAGTYKFYAEVDDGVRIWVDDKLILDEWQDSQWHKTSAKVTLKEGKHKVRVEYYEHGGDASIRVWWELKVAPTDTPTPDPDATISGTVWSDQCALTGFSAPDPGDTTGCIETSGGTYQANGVRDAGEAGLAGITVHLMDATCSGSALAVTITDAQGDYKFDKLDADTYCVVISTGAPNDAILGIGLWTAPNDSGTFTITVAKSETKSNIDFGWDVSDK